MAASTSRTIFAAIGAAAINFGVAAARTGPKSSDSKTIQATIELYGGSLGRFFGYLTVVPVGLLIAFKAIDGIAGIVWSWKVSKFVWKKFMPSPASTTVAS